MTIAFCDDMPETISDIKKIVKDFFIMKGVPVKIDTYDSSIELLNSTRDGTLYNIYFIDYEMPNINGEELVTVLRKYAPDSIIGYTSMYDNVGTSACRAGCDMYLYKQFGKNEIESELERIYIKLLKHKTMFTFSLPDNSQKQTLIIDIQYIESLHRHLYVHTINETFEVSGRTLKDFEKYIEFSDFVRISKSFFINSNNVEERYYKKGHYVLMRDGAKFKITYKDIIGF